MLEHAYARWSHQLSVQAVPFLVYGLNKFILFRRLCRHPHHPLHEVRIERLTNRVDHLHSGSFQGLYKLPLHQVDTLHEGFDGARTLKLIHALRAAALPSIPLTDALAAAPFLRWERSAGLEAAREALTVA